MTSNRVSAVDASYLAISVADLQLPDGSKKANLDEIAVDMMALVGSYDTAVLVSGDGDLAYAVMRLVIAALA